MSKTAKPKVSYHKWSDQHYASICGRRVYLGKDRKKAEQRLDEILRGTIPEKVTVYDVAQSFMHFHEQRVLGGELSEDSWLNYRRAALEFVRCFGKPRLMETLRPADWVKLREQLNAKLKSPFTRDAWLGTIRRMLKHAVEAELIRKMPNTGQSLVAPTATAKRKQLAKTTKLIPLEEVRHLLDNASETTKPMFLLALNCAFTQADLAGLRTDHIQGEWLNFPRPKTAIDRRCWLWPETTDCLPAANDDDRIFGLDAAVIRKRLYREMGRLGVNFSPGCIRHTSLTELGNHGDATCVELIAGHCGRGVTRRHYVHEVSRERIRDASEHLRRWVFGERHTDEPHKPLGWRIVG